MKKSTGIYCAYDPRTGRFPFSSLGCSDPKWLSEKFPSLEVVEINSKIPKEIPHHENYKIIKEGEEYKLKLLPAEERWEIEIDGSNSIEVSSGTKSETYTINKKDADGKYVKKGSEDIEIKVSRGLLNESSIKLIDGAGLFKLSSVLETVSSKIFIIHDGKIVGNKTINFVQGAE